MGLLVRWGGDDAEVTIAEMTSLGVELAATSATFPDAEEIAPEGGANLALDILVIERATELVCFLQCFSLCIVTVYLKRAV